LRNAVDKCVWIDGHSNIIALALANVFYAVRLGNRGLAGSTFPQFKKCWELLKLM